MLSLHLSLLFLVATTIAQGPTKRQWSVNTNKEKLDLHAVAQDSTFHDEFHFQLYTYNDEQGNFGTDLHYKANQAGNKTDMHFQFEFGQIVEFPSSSPDIVYDITSNPISTWPQRKGPTASPGHRMWGDWESQTSVVDGVITRQWSRTDGVILFRVKIAEALLHTASYSMTPNMVKIDIEVNNYPYAQTENSRLGVYTWIQSQTKVKSHDKGKHNFIFRDDDSGAGMPLGTVAWVPEIIINNSSSVPVEALTYQNGDQWEVYFTFVTPQDAIHPNNIYWDPSMGLDYDTPNDEFCIGTLCGLNAWLVIAGVGVAVILVISVLVVVLVRRKRQGYSVINQ